MTDVRRSRALVPTRVEARLARDSRRSLARCGRGDLPIRIAGTRKPVILPKPAVALLMQLLSDMGKGQGVTVVSVDAELTTQQAADLLGVSRPFLIGQIAGRRIPCRKVGSHRRLLLKDVTAYRRQIEARRLKTLDKLAAQAQELDLGY